MFSNKIIVLGNVLVPISREESVESTKEYRILGAHWYGKRFICEGGKIWF